MEHTNDRNPDEKLPVIRISVRNLVEFLLRSGDIDTAMPSGRDQDAMLAGGRIHRKIQKAEQKRTAGHYVPEVSLKKDTAFDDLILRVEGRADGILDESSGGERTVMIDEIKGMYLDVASLEKPFPLHLAQAKCYAFFYADQNSFSSITVRMTYANLDTEEIRYFSFSYPTSELRSWFEQLVREYYRWAKWQLAHRRNRDASMQRLQFPFPYRTGQKKLAAAVYHTIREGKELFLMAPTGVGKTMSCVFPAVRAVGEGYGDRIFYLTAKNETLEAGAEAFRILRKHGLRFKTVQITAKEKICPLQEVSCTPADCPYAKGHFDRINDALYEVLTKSGTDAFEGEAIRQQAEQFKVCPYELVRDLAEWCDGILCDYNYVFDPRARLRKFFGEGAKSDAIFLVDEAHNLVDRGREMYSASLCKEDVLAAKRLLPESYKKEKRALAKVNSRMLELRHALEEADASPGQNGSARAVGENCALISLSELEALQYDCLHAYEAVQNLFQHAEDGGLKEKLLDFYFALGNFCSVLESADEQYQPYLQIRNVQEDGRERKKFSVNLFCVNPAALLTECVDRGRTAVFFSATLLPVSYFKELLTVRSDCYAVYAESPFLKENRKILIGQDVSTRYRQRGSGMYRRIAFYIRAAAKAEKGNYFAFFPSYRMMREVFRIYREEFDCPEINYVMQGPHMDETDREIFLENFYEHADRSLVAFAVMGGVFSEGIDLTGTRLIGAIVVGAGLPQVSGERRVLQQYYEEKGKDGFRYAYLYPGMNKVEQAAGRVIRTDSDRGVIMLLDQRFLGRTYRDLFPREWADAEACSMETVEEQLKAFWNGQEKQCPDDRNRRYSG